MKKVLSCILSFLPGILLLISLMSVIYISLYMEGEIRGEDMALAISMIVTSLLAVIACFGVMIIYVIKVYKNPQMSSGTKIMWYICLYFFNVLIFPVFWFIYIRKE